MLLTFRTRFEPRDGWGKAGQGAGDSPDGREVTPPELAHNHVSSIGAVDVSDPNWVVASLFVIAQFLLLVREDALETDRRLRGRGRAWLVGCVERSGVTACMRVLVRRVRVVVGGRDGHRDRGSVHRLGRAGSVEASLGTRFGGARECARMNLDGCEIREG